MAESDRSVWRGAERGLGVTPRIRARSRVADMSDGDVASQALKGLFREHLVHQALVFVDQNLGAVRGCDTGGLLSSVLQSI